MWSSWLRLEWIYLSKKKKSSNIKIHWCKIRFWFSPKVFLDYWSAFNKKIVNKGLSLSYKLYAWRAKISVSSRNNLLLCFTCLYQAFNYLRKLILLNIKRAKFRSQLCNLLYLPLKFSTVTI